MGPTAKSEKNPVFLESHWIQDYWQRKIAAQKILSWRMETFDNIFAS